MHKLLGIVALCVACGATVKPPPLKPASLATDQGNVDFATTSPGATSAEVSVRATNVGETPTPAVITTVSGSDPGAFVVTADNCAGAVLAPAASCEVRLAFHPGEERQFAAELRIAAGSAAAVVAVRGRAEDGSRLSMSKTAQSFSGVDLGQSATAFITIANPGTAPTSALSFDAAGDTGSFLVGGNCIGRALAPKQSCDLQVTFRPQSVGAKALALTVLGSRSGPARATFDGYGKRLVALTVSTEGDGTVRVSGGFDSCTTAPCRVRFEIGSPAAVKAMLTAVPGARSLFGEWVGGCPGSATSCEISIDGDRSVLAKFVPAVAVTLEANVLAGGTGVIGVEPGGAGCAAPCRAGGLVRRSSTVRLTAGAGPGSQFRWSGDCRGTSPTCDLPANADISAGVVFNGANYVFVTSLSYRTDLGLKAYDQACNDRARVADLPGPYLAWLSTTAMDAATRFSEARGFIRVDGRPFADTLGGNSPVYFPPAHDEFGQMSTPFPGAVLSGSDEFGRLVPGNNCFDWTSSGAYPLRLGNALGGTLAWTGWGSTSCGTTWPILCMGTGIRRPLQREKLTGRLAFVSAAGLSSGGGLAAADAVCTNDARAWGLKGSFRALLAVEGASAASRFDLGGPPWVRADGVPVVEMASDLALGKIVAPIELGPDSTWHFWTWTWTGARTPGQPGTTASTCGSWTSTAEGSYANWGLANSIDPEFWFGAYGVPCQANFQYHVYCLQQ
jgi:hypothetical protein